MIIEDDCLSVPARKLLKVLLLNAVPCFPWVFSSVPRPGVDRETGEVHIGRVPAYSVVVPGTLPGKSLPDGTPGPNLACAVIIKQVDKNKVRPRSTICCGTDKTHDNTPARTSAFAGIDPLPIGYTGGRRGARPAQQTERCGIYLPQAAFRFG